MIWVLLWPLVRAVGLWAPGICVAWVEEFMAAEVVVDGLAAALPGWLLPDVHG